MNAAGQRVVKVDARQALARVSLVHGGTVDALPDDWDWDSLPVLADDYILPSEPVVVSSEIIDGNLHH